MNPTTLRSVPTGTAAGSASVLPGITVVLATRNRAETLARCLASVFACDYPDFDVVVVDNAPSDDTTRDLVEELVSTTDHPLRYVREDRPGLARAHNAALPYVIGSIVAFTDDDVVVEPSWLSAVVRGFARADNVACVTGMIAAAELETPAQRWIEAYAGYGKGDQPRVFDLGPNRPDDPLFPFTAGTMGSGANMAFRTAYLREIGGFPDSLGAGTLAKGGDDLAAFHEVVMRGYQLVYEPAAIIHHHHHRTEEALARQLHGYGVGLGAYLTHVVVTRPSSMLAMVRRAIGGVRHITSDDSEKNQRRPDGLPEAFVRGERRGMLLGPWCYLRSRLRVAAEDRAARRGGRS